MPPTDQQLIAAYLNGDETAFAELLNRHLKPVYNFIYRLSGPAEAEDLTQETFLKAWKNLRKYKPDKKFKTWLFSIARNTAIDWLRRKKKLVFSDFETKDGANFLLDSLTDTQPWPDEILARAQDREWVDNLLNGLLPQSKEVLLLYYGEDLTFEEIGQILKKPLNTVKSQHYRALMELRKILNAPKTPSKP